MGERGVTEFSGVAGSALRGSFAASSLVTGLSVGLMLLVGNWVLWTAGADRLTPLFSQAVVASALARFALNGRSGEWGGTVFSSAGGSWGAVSQVTVRYLALASVWLIPAMLLELGGGADESLLGLGGLTAAAGLYGLAVVLTSPMFLIVAVSAEDFGELFSMAHWRRLFDSRLHDLFALYVVYVGSMTMVLVLSLPLAILAGSISYRVALLFAAVAACFATGVGFSLLGRLCGFFASDAASLTRPAAGVVTAEPAVQTPRAAELDPLTVSSRPQAPLPDLAPRPPVEKPGGVRPPLLDAKPHVDAALSKLSAGDAEGAVAALEQLRREYAPHPQVLYALFRIHHQARRMERAVEAANAAFAPCIERGAFKPAAEMFRSLADQIDRLELSEDQMVTIGAALFHAGDMDAAATAYSTVIDRNPDSTRAIKGMMKVADLLVHRLERASDAIRVYGYLLERCPESPLAEFMNQGIAVARRRGGVPE